MRRQRGATVKSLPPPNRHKNFLPGDKVEKSNHPFPSERHLWLIAIQNV
jgi:hypothetical protein